MISSQGAPLGKRLSEALGKLVEYNKQLAMQQQQEAQKAKSTSTILISSLTMIGGVLVGVLGVMLIRNITRSVNAMLGAVTRIEHELDFTARVPASRRQLP